MINTFLTGFAYGFGIALGVGIVFILVSIVLAQLNKKRIGKDKNEIQGMLNQIDGMIKTQIASNLATGLNNDIHGGISH